MFQISGANTKCVNTPGDYKCECAEGYALDEDKKCVEVAECIDDDSCGDNAICEDLKGKIGNQIKVQNCQKGQPLNSQEK